MLACRILVPRLCGIEPVPPAVEAWNPNHWTARLFSNNVNVFNATEVYT